eukprot:scaffold14973_cov207-Alexandrium_tamarense.AAC.1
MRDEKKASKQAAFKQTNNEPKTHLAGTLLSNSATAIVIPSANTHCCGDTPSNTAASASQSSAANNSESTSSSVSRKGSGDGG